MTEKCPGGFDQVLLSGYLDRELTQGTFQRVQVHLADCEACRSVLDDLSRLREVTLSTKLLTPPDDQWKETPLTPSSRLFRRAGWGLVMIWGVWALAVAGYALWQFATGPERLLEKVCVFGGISGVLLLFLSVLMDRLRLARSDPYTRVQR